MPPIKRKSWNHDAMIWAVDAVRSKEIGYLKESKHFGVPKGTLARYVKKDAKAEVLVKVRMGRAPVLPDYLEVELGKYCKESDQRFYGLRLKDMKYMEFQFTMMNNLKNTFNLTKQSAGEKWLRGFISRHPDLSVRTPEAVSVATVKEFNPVAVNKFFDLYEPEIDKMQSTSHGAYNVDETGITVVQHTRSKVISLKEKQKVAALTSLGRGKLINILTCMNTSDEFVIFNDEDQGQQSPDRRSQIHQPSPEHGVSNENLKETRRETTSAPPAPEIGVRSMGFRVFGNGAVEAVSEVEQGKFVAEEIEVVDAVVDTEEAKEVDIVEVEGKVEVGEVVDSVGVKEVDIDVVEEMVVGTAVVVVGIGAAAVMEGLVDT
ncbi:unnamed protein product [Acanthoscelides obtectus]|uniref:HTH psq-type domain-containing protein n=1 Tax=Acanthoscelides obtectus TaxID=200917 RepID=A0A9P0PWC7_ACAOB|nr:unnamed protein product [Acanthoscelides obtectus]CAK1663907.1 hypothetical protein AOBTE_LOCUS23924 [Acanthoscelides obtectus]